MEKATSRNKIPANSQQQKPRKIQKSFWENHFWPAAGVSLFALMMNLRQTLSPLSSGLDNSFDYAFNKAALMHLSFGDKFISTYGPLGYLTHDYLPQFVIQSTLVLIVYAIALGCGAYIFARKCSRGDSLWKILLIAGIITYVFSMGSSVDIDWNYLTLYLLYAFLYISSDLSLRARRISLAMLTVFASVLLYIRFAHGVAALGAMVCLPLGELNIFSKKDRKKIFVHSFTEIVGVVAIYLLFADIIGRLLHVNSLISYTRTGWAMSNGFSAAMYYHLPGTFIATVVCAGTLFLLTTMYLVPLPGSRIRVREALVIFIPILIGWKYTVVRQDAHVTFITQIALPLAIVAIFLRFQDKLVNQVVVGVLGLSVIVLSIVATPFNKLPVHQVVQPIIVSPLNDWANLDFIRAFDFTREKQTWSRQSNSLLLPDVLPPTFLKIIGRSGVDVYPWETSIIAANNLNWSPRPSPFSFESYSPLFDNLNAAYYASAQSPKFILWHNTHTADINGIDGRNVLWDEPKTVREIMQRYKVLATTDDFILLGKNPGRSTLQPLNRVETQTVAWSKWVSVPFAPASGKYVALAASYTLGTRIRLQNLLLWNQTVSMLLQHQNGKVSQYRIVTANLGQGFLISPVPYNWDGLINLFSRQAVNPVVSVKFAANANYIHDVSPVRIVWSDF